MMKAHWVLGFLLFTACEDARETDVEVAAAAESFVAHECEVCGMILREQPAPRGQVVHRDGTRNYFCSIGDLVAYGAAPSPHGEATGTYVEVLEADVDPSIVSAEQRSWRDVGDVTFVVGGLVRPVMGEPVLTFDDASEGAAAAERLGARTVRWGGLAAAVAPSSERE